MNEWTSARGHSVAVLFSERSRAAYARTAAAAGETYTFTDAQGQPRTWLKGEHAYLAVNAASVLLARCNLKHDVVEEAQLDAAVLAGCDALLVPNAAHLSAATIGRIEDWMRDPSRRLVVTGKTNLPPHLLGLTSMAAQATSGYTGWRWLADSPFEGPAWQRLYVSGYRGHAVQRVEPLADSCVLAELLEFSGDLADADVVTSTTIGPGIVMTDRTVYIATRRSS